jgi:hypothetical protein
MASNSPVPAPKILQEAVQCLMQRGVDYDSKNGERSMAHAVEIFNVIVGGDKRLTEHEGWIFMRALKQARMMQGKPKLDTYVDLAAYAGLAGECALASRMNASQPPESV